MEKFLKLIKKIYKKLKTNKHIRQKLKKKINNYNIN